MLFNVQKEKTHAGFEVGYEGASKTHDDQQDKNQHQVAVCSERVAARSAAVLTEPFPLRSAHISSQHVARTPLRNLARSWGLRRALRLKAN